MSDIKTATEGTTIVCTTIADVRAEIQKLKHSGKRIGFVPTMGALHAGHLSLIQHARQNSEAVVVSIFVNPTQFGPNEDYENYPRQVESDINDCGKEGVSIVFVPDRDEVYDEKNYLTISVDELNNHMCGGSRPGFFEGILMIVNKLFNIIKPDVAVFGQKDIQQVQIIKQMVHEFNHDVEILSAPIVRANDGLALSSRNAYLDQEERVIAPSLYRALQYIESQVGSGVDIPKLLIEHQKSELEAKGLRIDYLDLFDKKTLQPVSALTKGNEYIIAGAVYLGETRLIDNILIEL